MLILGLGLMAVGVLGATLDAPVTSVTVYSDQAQVVRSGSLTVSGSRRVTFPQLPKNVDTDSIRVEAEGAEVSHVDVRIVKGESFSHDEARKLIASMEEIDAALARITAERNVHHAQIEALRRVRPSAQSDSEAARAQTPPTTWNAAVSFLVDNVARMEARMRELEAQSATLQKEQQQYKERATMLGKTFGEPGVEVTATLTGKGATEVALTYLATSARWYPHYELQFQPETQRMQMAFYGRVSQETGEDWESARLTLSTALPANAMELPKLSTWKLGIRERFIPTPRPHEESVQPAPDASNTPSQTTASAEEMLRSQLLRLAGERGLTQPAASKPQVTAQREQGGLGAIRGTIIDAQSRQTLSDVVVTATSSSSEAEHVTVTDAKGEYLLPRLPSGAYTVRYEREGYKPYARNSIQLRSSRTLRVNAELLPDSLNEAIEIVGRPPTIDVGSTTMGVNIDQEFIKRIPVANRDGSIQRSMSLTPPPGWRPPIFAPESPVAAAGGYNLTFSSQHPETLLSNKGERSLPLVSESWPVQVERKIFPALSPNTYLVATLQGPSRNVFPGGDASLFVGADPAGTATLTTIVPGESFTLPLGIDRAVRSARDVRLVESEKGFISKDEVGTYEVTIEVPNPYPFPLAVSVVDQLPLNKDGKVEVALVRAGPSPQFDKGTGKLQWDVVVPPSSKSTVSFQYTLSRPKGWRLYQRYQN
ncbi:mucoidy inhibitor MuiA family protein [Myxococcus sp. NMCA1]|uniref:mucoidy inhibitor MuiA family protein n=1 Tax=Myxococcus sp. NMCA1 TaxID=2996785 RepID=UPI0022858132|nr:mucoidy inhibitor MuiA family protein [Myxococcus sp. NMCA1]WAM27455.1 mucoidy inhibitor MuiA family protein [Myxococcus sp. NMCA1]